MLIASCRYTPTEAVRSFHTPVESLTIEQGEGVNMADDKMKNDDLDRRLGGAGREDEGYGQQTPGRNPKDDRSQGQRGGGMGNPSDLDDDDDDLRSGQGSRQGNKGGQNR
jgi:hypothetical protein